MFNWVQISCLFYNLGLTFNSFNNSFLFCHLYKRKNRFKPCFAYLRDKSRIMNLKFYRQKSHNSVVAWSNFFQLTRKISNTITKKCCLFSEEYGNGDDYILEPKDNHEQSNVEVQQKLISESVEGNHLEVKQHDSVPKPKVTSKPKYIQHDLAQDLLSVYACL